MVTTATAVAVPKGTPRMPATIGRMNDRFVFMTISMAPKADFEAVRIRRQAWKTVGLHAVEVPHNVQHLAFTRNGHWQYGPLN